MVRCTSAIGLHRSDSTTTSDCGEGAKDGGRLRALGRVVHDRLGHLLDDVAARARAHQARECRRARRPRPAPRRARTATTSARSSLVSQHERARRTPSRASGPARSTPCARLPIRARAHRDGRRAPSGASRRARAGSPDTKRRNCQKFSPGAGAAAAVQAVDHGRGDAARFEDQPRHRRRQRAARAGRLAGRLGLECTVIGLRRHRAIRCAT